MIGVIQKARCVTPVGYWYMWSIVEKFENSKFEVPANLLIIVLVLVCKYRETIRNAVSAIDVSPLGTC